MIFPVPDYRTYDGELIDVRAFNFPVHAYEINGFRHEFFDVLDEDVLHPGRERVFIVYGYPTQLQEFDYDEKPRVHGRCVHTIGLYDGASHAPYMHRLS